jgi:hypothetical protein
MADVGEKPRARPRVDLRAEVEDDEAPPARPPAAAAARATPELSEPPQATSEDVNALRADLAFAQIEIASLKDALSKAEKAVEKSAPASGVAPIDALDRETKARTKADDRAALGERVLEGVRVELEVSRATLGEAKAAHAKELASRDARLAALESELAALRASGASPRSTTAKPDGHPDPAAAEAALAGSGDNEDYGDVEVVPTSASAPAKPKVDISGLLAAGAPERKTGLAAVSPATWFKIVVFAAVGLVAYSSREPVLGFISRTREAPHVYATKVALANLASAVQAEANGEQMRPDDFDTMLDGYAKKSESLAKDAWGTRFRLDPSPYGLRSAGPDLQYETEDDLTLELSGAPAASSGAPSP